MRVAEMLSAFGHKQIRATHPATLEITKEKTLTPRGDCIIAIGASKGSYDLDWKFKQLAQHADTRIFLTLNVGGMVETVKGYGDPKLDFSHPTDLVVRKSSYICSRTIMIKADKAAVNVSRRIVSLLKNHETQVYVKLEAVL